MTALGVLVLNGYPFHLSPAINSFILTHLVASASSYRCYEIQSYVCIEFILNTIILHAFKI